MKSTSYCCLLIFCFFVETTLISQNLEKELTNELTQHFEKSNLPGFAVAIVKEKEIVYQHGFGHADKTTQKPFTVHTIQNIGSVTKTVVGVAVVQAIAAGKLSMDTKINDVLPFKVENPYFKDQPILMRHLVTHTSSILDTKFYGHTYVASDYQSTAENIHEDFLDYIKSHEKMELGGFLKLILHKNGKWYKKKNFLKARPGATNEYSNLNAALAAYIVELIMEMPFQEYAKKEILSPLKMTNSAWIYQNSIADKYATVYFPKGKTVPYYTLNTYPDGGLLSSVADLSLFLQMLIKAYNGDSSFLSKESAALLLPGDEDQERAFIGMGQKSRNIGHSGGGPGIQTDLQFNADSKIGRIIFANVNADEDEALLKEYRMIHTILAKYETKWKTHP